MKYRDIWRVRQNHTADAPPAEGGWIYLFRKRAVLCRDQGLQQRGSRRFLPDLLSGPQGDGPGLQCLRRSFLSSILFPAFCRLPADQREQLSQYLSRVRRWDFRAFIDFFCTVLDSLGNPLLASLFAESTMFGHLSDLYMMTDASYSDFYFDRLANYMEDLLTCHAAEDFGGIKRQLDQISQLGRRSCGRTWKLPTPEPVSRFQFQFRSDGTSPWAESNTDPLPHRFSFTEFYAVSTSRGIPAVCLAAGGGIFRGGDHHTPESFAAGQF